MIADDEKLSAWRCLWLRLESEQLREELGLSKEQRDYLRARLSREAFPGEDAKTVRRAQRDSILVFAVCVVKAQGALSDAKIFGKLAKHYGVSASKVKRAYLAGRWLFERPFDVKFADGTQFTAQPLEQRWLAEQELPDINFDEFAE